VRIGFSTHESPDNTEPVKIAVAKGAVIFEKHVGLATEAITLNAYSATPGQVAMWLKAAVEAFAICGDKTGRYLPSEKETADLASLQRGAFAKVDVADNKQLSQEDIYLAFPCNPGQLLASHLSKYVTLKLKNNGITKDSPIYLSDVEMTDNTSKIYKIVNAVLDLIKKSGAVVPVDSTCEISHHYGLDSFNDVGVTIINCINREYCKKILVVLPGQRNPEHKHLKKEETFLVLYGELDINYGGRNTVVRKGESLTIERGTPHDFSSATGCVFEEISTMHSVDDSYYTEEEGGFVKPRKTEVYITKDVLLNK
jgi:mannose-6-phosphate isomerase-like protein (cupin superfamily)